MSNDQETAPVPMDRREIGVICGGLDRRAADFGRPRWIGVGKHGAPWTVELARKEAKRLLGPVAAGIDPADARDMAKGDLTISELCDLLLKEGCPKQRKT